MKNDSNKTFINQLKERFREIREMRSGDIHIFSVDARYGHYQITIGPARNSKGSAEQHRKIEIEGEIDHLFVSPEALQPFPTKKEADKNLRHTVIMKGVKVRICDPKGDGRHVLQRLEDETAIEAREYINIAGKEGARLMEEAIHSQNVLMDTYRLIQKDILSSMEERAE